MQKAERNGKQQAETSAQLTAFGLSELSYPALAARQRLAGDEVRGVDGFRSGS